MRLSRGSSGEERTTFTIPRAFRDRCPGAPVLSTTCSLGKLRLRLVSPRDARRQVRDSRPRTRRLSRACILSGPHLAIADLARFVWPETSGAIAPGFDVGPFSFSVSRVRLLRASQLSLCSELGERIAS